MRKSKPHGTALAWLCKLSLGYGYFFAATFGSRGYSRLIHGRSDTLREDAMIAATARVHELTIATSNDCDFKMFSVPLFNPFREQGSCFFRTARTLCQVLLFAQSCAFARADSLERFSNIAAIFRTSASNAECSARGYGRVELNPE
jgi:hypothetical protein